MYTLSGFRRRLVSGEDEREVQLQAGTAGWLPAQQHHGENVGDTPTHVLFVELKDTPAAGLRPLDGQRTNDLGPRLPPSGAS